MAESRPRRYAVDSTDGFKVVDYDQKRAMCTCDNVSDATHIANALNFNHKPRNYGYVLERTDERNDG